MKNIIRIYSVPLLVLTFLGLYLTTFSQNKIININQNQIIDSLFILSEKTNSDSSKARFFIQIGQQYEKQNPDSALRYYFLAQKTIKPHQSQPQNKLLLAKTLLAQSLVYCINKRQFDSAMICNEQAFTIFNHLLQSKNPIVENQAHKGLAGCYFCLGNIFDLQGNYEKANDYFFKSLKIHETEKNRKEILTLNSKIGVSYWSMGSYDKAMEYLLKTLKLAEELGDNKGKAMCYINIGNVQSELFNYESSIDYYLKASVIFEKIDDKKGMSISYNNIGAVYAEFGYNKQAIEYYRKSLKIKEELNDIKGISSCYVNLGSAYKWLNDFKLSNDFYMKALKINEDIKDKNGIATVTNFIAILHLILADSVVTTKIEKEFHYKEAIKYSEKSYQIGKEINAIMRINNAARQLQKTYKTLGNTAKALEYAEIFESSNEQLFKEEKLKAISEMVSKYNNEKKQRKIELLEKNNALQKKELARQRILRNSFFAGFLLLLLATIITLKYYRQKRKANQLLTLKNNEIELQKIEIELAHQLISEKNNIIIESIENAKTIQDAVFTSNEKLSNLFPDHFVLFLPKDIVSGDFYWAYQSKNNKIFWAAADCTGHGVSGAFMTIIGNSLLNKIIIEDGIEEPNIILDKLRNAIIKTLNKDPESNIIDKIRHGMDIALCVWNQNTNQLQFSGANSSVLIIRNIFSENETNLISKTHELLEPVIELVEIKGDKQPIGYFKKASSFQVKTFDLLKNDKIYLFSDGFSDQIGGLNEQRFKINQLKNTILEICDLPMQKQNEKLQEIYRKWKGNIDQIDDVVMIGVQI